MLPRLCPPVPPFHPAYPRAWFMQLDACLAVNGVTAQPLMHDILLDALPAELRHLPAASSSSPQPYDDLCAAVLARYGETYHPLPGTREFRVSPPSKRAVPPGPQPSHDLDTSDTSGSTTATSPHALEPAIDTDIVTPAVRPPIAEASPAMSNEPAFSTSTLCASFQQELPSSSKSPAADVQAHNQLQPNVRDAATMTENPEDYPPGLPQVDQTAYAQPATQAYNPPAAPHTRSPSPTKQLHSVTTAVPSSSLSSTAHHTEISRATSICSARLVARLHSTRQLMQQPHPVMYHRQRRYRRRRRNNCVARPSRLRSRRRWRIENLTTGDDEVYEDGASKPRVSVPITLCFVIMIGYISGGAVIFSLWEGWEFLDGSYFCFVTLSTIGFGDLVPGDTVVSDSGSQEKLVICSLYLLVGMALIAMCFNLMQEEVIYKVRNCGKRIGIIKDTDDDEDFS
ncbi:hypothetical protein HPB52_013446 [Rhipicephalus sanguineus]|uniref:Potassium channel domain-containing protein n=1 Tax=Rhipicephalus sanguineus TaxID=34632 RepID=A0A9D4SWW8_RHISA|nr:hypothetical protein HPB52_013446 [Rhipicephalus sanguineus]